MMNYCNVCGAPNGHLPGCPEAPQEPPVCQCLRCGCDLYAGDQAYKVGVNHPRYYCEDCCSLVEIEAPEPYTYEDYLEDKYERERHDV